MASLRRAEDLIRAGRVTVDGVPARIGEKFDADRARVEVDGFPLPVRPDLVYYLLNKPPGVVSTTRDPQRRPTVTSLVPATPRVFPVGRLDADSEGLLLLTNDGELANLITHPRYGISKTYVARVSGRPRKKTIVQLTTGVELDDGPARALRARILDQIPQEGLIEVTMGEGRKREVRRMLETLGHPVLRLVRTAIGTLKDRSLQPGDWRELSPAEVHRLFSGAGAAWDDAEVPDGEAD